MKTVETLTYTNSLGETLVFSHTSVYCAQNIEGLSDVRNTIYSINSMGQDGDTFVSNRLESRDIDISGFIRERDPEKLRSYRRKLARILNPQLSATLTYTFGSFTRVISCRSLNAPVIIKLAGSIYTAFSVQLVCLNPFWREEAEKRDEIAAWIGSLYFLWRSRRWACSLDTGSRALLSMCITAATFGRACGSNSKRWAMS